MFVALLMAVQRAMVTARFAFGRGMVDETQDRMIWKTEKAPHACKNMAWWGEDSPLVREYQGGQCGHTYKVPGSDVQGRRGQDLPYDRSNAATDDVKAPLVGSAAVP